MDARVPERSLEAAGRKDPPGVAPLSRFFCQLLMAERQHANLPGVAAQTLRRWRSTGGGPRSVFLGAAVVRCRPRDVACCLQTRTRQGQLLGHPRRDVDVERAIAMLKAGRSQRSVAMVLKVLRATLRRAIERKLAGERS